MWWWILRIGRFFLVVDLGMMLSRVRGGMWGIGG